MPRQTTCTAVLLLFKCSLSQLHHISLQMNFSNKLHWLPIEWRIWFKLAILTFKALHTGRPPYLSDLLHYHEPMRSCAHPVLISFRFPVTTYRLDLVRFDFHSQSLEFIYRSASANLTCFLLLDAM